MPAAPGGNCSLCSPVNYASNATVRNVTVDTVLLKESTDVDS